MSIDDCGSVPRHPQFLTSTTTFRAIFPLCFKMANVFLSIPQELRIQILSHLDAVSLARCAMTCKSIYATLENSSLLTYTIQLHFDGLKDVGTSSTHSELLKSLLRRRQAWFSLDCTTHTTCSMQHICRAYEFVGGVLASSDRHHLEIAWLPMASNPEGHTLQRCLAGISVRDFTMDPTQDMIALLEEDGSPPSLTDARACRIHIRTISTDRAHPLAHQDVLHFSIFPDPERSAANDIWNVYLEIAKNILVVVLHLDATWHAMRVLVWDWITSDLIVDSSIAFDSLLPHPRFEFAILDSTSCFVTSASDSGSIRLYKLVHLINAPAIHLATLHFPPIARGTGVIRVCTYAGPMEAQPLSQTPFMVNDEDRLHVLTVVYGHPNITSSKMNIFVHQRVFTKYISPQISSPEDYLPLDIPWEQWGPPNTKIIYPARTEIDNWSRYIHGQRVVFPKHVNGANGGLEEVPN
ncbi:hypothetical protein BJ912DRAFT_878606, partial [Pholiota molesta]